jgi:hypothetical protein
MGEELCCNVALCCNLLLIADYVVLFGGKDANCKLGQTWLLSTVTLNVPNVVSAMNRLDSDRVPPVSKFFTHDPTCSAITR